MIQRRVYRLKAGNIDRLRIQNEALSNPGNYQVQVKVHSIGLNFADVFAILGLYSATPKGSFIPGLEFSGEITQVGKEVRRYKIGDRIMGVTRFGAYVSHINIESQYVIPLPDGWNSQHGAAYLVQVLTAYYGLKNLGGIKEGYTVLIHSAAGGVGLWANRICKKAGAFTIGTVGTESKLDLCHKEGYDKVFVRNVKTFDKNLDLALEDRSLDLIMESIGGEIMKMGYQKLSPMGRLILFGSAHYGERKDRPNYIRLIIKYLNRPKIDPQNMIKDNKSVMAFNLIYLFDHVELMDEVLQKLSLLDLGKPFIGHQYRFEDIRDAIRFFQSGKSVGKVVVNLDH